LAEILRNLQDNQICA